MPNLLAGGWPVRLGGQRDSLIKAADLSRLISGRNRGPLRSGRRLERIEPAGEIEVVAEVGGGRRASRVVDHDRDVELVQRPMGAEFSWHPLHLAVQVAEYGVLVAEDDQIAD